jgi:hypothetical protein
MRWGVLLDGRTRNRESRDKAKILRKLFRSGGAEALASIVLVGDRLPPLGERARVVTDR